MEEEQDLLGTLLGKELEPGAVRELLEGMGLKPTYENGIYLQILRKAAGGDFSAAKYVLEAAAARRREDAPPDAWETVCTLPTAVLVRLAGDAPND